MKTPVYRRLDAFRAGPQTVEFCLCETHKDEISACFIPHSERTELAPEDAEDEECYFCRGEEGP